MRVLRVHQIRQTRDAMELLLRKGIGLKPNELADRLLKLKHFRHLNCDCLYGLVGLAVRTYDRSFYRDPGNRKIYWTGKRLAEMQADARTRENHPILGTTAAARIHDALEAAEA